MLKPYIQFDISEALEKESSLLNRNRNWIAGKRNMKIKMTYKLE